MTTQNTSEPESHGDGGATHQAQLLEQYKLYVEMMDRVSARRHSTNTYFLSINTALLTFLGILNTVGLKALLPAWTVFVATGGVILCYCWYRLVRSYKGLNTGKFKVIHAMEKQLPVALFDDEWKILGEGKDPDRYLPFTHVEMRVPWVFAALYLVLSTWSVLRAVCGAPG